MKRVTRLLAIVMALVMALSVVPVFTLALTPTEIVDAAYALETGKTLDGTYTLTGEITKIQTPYDSSYKNISVVIVVAGREDKPILCYRLKGDGVAALAVKDTITVTGSLTNYKGTIEFTSGCTLDAVVPGGGEAPVAPCDPKQIVDDAYALPANETLPYAVNLIGQVTAIDTPYDAEYKNISFTIAVEGREDKPILVYRIKGTGADTLTVGQYVAVKGNLQNYTKTNTETGVTTSKIELVSGSLLAIVDAPTDLSAKEIVEAAYALEKDAELSYLVTLTGKIVSIDTPFDAKFNNITVTIAVEGCEDKTIQCFRLVGEGIDTLAVDDIITVTGVISNYKGTTVEFIQSCYLDTAEEVPDYGTVGDVTGDGKINMADVAKAFAHVRNKSKLTDEGALFRADATGDGKINMADIARIFAHVRGKNPLA